MKIFIDGKEGTTGLRIFERLADRTDVEVTSLPESIRKDPTARQDAIGAADIAILCLPDAAAKESVALAAGTNTRILDTSTAHRVSPQWVYGFPELSATHRQRIASSSKVAVPGCHASGFVSLVTPLTASGLLSKDALLSCFSVTGYSGGGKKMIAEYEGERVQQALNSPRQYALTQSHKHLPEMTCIPGLNNPPLFAPMVADFYSGMAVTIPLHRQQVNSNAPMKDIYECLQDHYHNAKVIKVLSSQETEVLNGFIPANMLSGKDSMQLMVQGNDERLQLIALFDNLGKGSSGAALQCLNLMLGAEETLGLNLID